tara:strand:- start:440 stop:625 length:186 start_codon:yes stop_codon:yes gene_type:complete
MIALPNLCRNYSAFRHEFPAWSETSCGGLAIALSESESFDTPEMTPHLVKVEPLIDGVGIP